MTTSTGWQPAPDLTFAASPVIGDGRRAGMVAVVLDNGDRTSLSARVRAETARRWAQALLTAADAADGL